MLLSYNTYKQDTSNPRVAASKVQACLCRQVERPALEVLAKNRPSPFFFFFFLLSSLHLQKPPGNNNVFYSDRSPLKPTGDIEHTLKQMEEFSFTFPSAHRWLGGCPGVISTRTRGSNVKPPIQTTNWEAQHWGRCQSATDSMAPSSAKVSVDLAKATSRFFSSPAHFIRHEHISQMRSVQESAKKVRHGGSQPFC